jgi:hypothetical protein
MYVVEISTDQAGIRIRTRDAESGEKRNFSVSESLGQGEQMRVTRPHLLADSLDYL